MRNKERLFEIADSQHGFFTALQAKNAGYLDSNFPRMLRSKDWIKELRGIYRLAQYPMAERPELIKTQSLTQWRQLKESLREKRGQERKIFIIDNVNQTHMIFL